MVESGPVRRIATLAGASANLQSYLREIAKFPRLTIEQERELGRRVQQLADEDALGALVESNLRFVVSYARRFRKLGVPVLELIREGNLGLLEGARRFNPERDGSFVRYVAWWVRQSILHRLADTAGLVALQMEPAPAPAMDDVIGGDLAFVDHEPSSAAARRRAARARRRQRHAADLDLPGMSSGFMMRGIEDDWMRDALVQQLESAMTQLDPWERQVIRLRYGLHSDEALDVYQVAERMQISRRRVRERESSAVQKLRREKSLRSYLN
jgi:RNA polymerase primary sigma factor